MTFIISCANDTSLAERVYQHLISSKRVNRDAVLLREDEIEIDENKWNVTKDDMNCINETESSTVNMAGVDTETDE